MWSETHQACCQRIDDSLSRQETTKQARDVVVPSHGGVRKAEEKLDFALKSICANARTVIRNFIDAVPLPITTILA